MADIRGLDPSGNPRDVAVGFDGATFVGGHVFRTPVQQVPGIGAASPYASGDAFGLRLRFTVPVEGTISNVVFLDYDDEGINKELVLFSSAFTATADNSAFAVTDVDLRLCVGVAYINTWSDFGNNRLGQAFPSLSYVAPEGFLYSQLVTRGADNIAAGAFPDIFLMVV